MHASRTGLGLFLYLPLKRGGRRIEEQINAAWPTSCDAPGGDHFLDPTPTFPLSGEAVPGSSRDPAARLGRLHPVFLHHNRGVGGGEMLDQGVRCRGILGFGPDRADNRGGTALLQNQPLRARSGLVA